MTLLLFLKPIYRDSHDPGFPAPTGGHTKKKKKRRKLSKRLVDLLRRVIPEMPAKDFNAEHQIRQRVEAFLREQETVAAKVHERVLKLLQEAEERRKRDEEELLMLILEDIL